MDKLLNTNPSSSSKNLVTISGITSVSLTLLLFYLVLGMITNTDTIIVTLIITTSLLFINSIIFIKMCYIYYDIKGQFTNVSTNI